MPSANYMMKPNLTKFLDNKSGISCEFIQVLKMSCAILSASSLDTLNYFSKCPHIDLKVERRAEINENYRVKPVKSKVAGSMMITLSFFFFFLQANCLFFMELFYRQGNKDLL